LRSGLQTFPQKRKQNLTLLAAPKPVDQVLP
jgi:hypothetical protein